MIELVGQLTARLIGLQPIPAREPQASPVTGDGQFAAFSRNNSEYGWGLVYHGTTRTYDELAPHLPVWERDGRIYPDSDVPVLSASDDPLVASFMALYPRRSRAAGFGGNGQGGITFYIPRENREAFESARGQVAVLRPRGMVKINLEAPVGWPDQATAHRLPELRGTQPQKPEEYRPATFKDFAGILATRPNCQLVYT
jgi:hypothetical protein